MESSYIHKRKERKKERKRNGDWIHVDEQGRTDDKTDHHPANPQPTQLNFHPVQVVDLMHSFIHSFKSCE